MDIIFQQFIYNLGGSDFIYGIMGIVISFVIVFNIIDYILD